MHRFNSNNPFEVLVQTLGLESNATETDVEAAGHLALANMRRGNSGNALAIRVVESAMEQLRDPVAKKHMELEWNLHKMLVCEHFHFAIMTIDEIIRVNPLVAVEMRDLRTKVASKLATVLLNQADKFMTENYYEARTLLEAALRFESIPLKRARILKQLEHLESYKKYNPQM